MTYKVMFKKPINERFLQFFAGHETVAREIFEDKYISKFSSALLIYGDSFEPTAISKNPDESEEFTFFKNVDGRREIDGTYKLMRYVP